MKWWSSEIERVFLTHYPPSTWEAPDCDQKLTDVPFLMRCWSPFDAYCFAIDFVAPRWSLKFVVCESLQLYASYKWPLLEILSSYLCSQVYLSLSPHRMEMLRWWCLLEMVSVVRPQRQRNHCGFWTTFIFDALTLVKCECAKSCIKIPM